MPTGYEPAGAERRLGAPQGLTRPAILPAATSGTATDAWQPLADASAAVPLFVLVAAIAVGFLFNRRDRLADRKPVQAAINEDITAYGEDLAELNPDRHNHAFPEDARVEYFQAVDLFVYAATTARARRSADVLALTTALEEGRWLLASVRARVAGEPPPPRWLPCFFDPRHGPSVATAAWAPLAGRVRDVPVCRTDLNKLHNGAEPDARLIMVGGARHPFWEAGPVYRGWASDYYSGYYGSALPGLLRDTMLGASLRFDSDGVDAYHGRHAQTGSGDAYWGDSDGGGDGGAGYDGGGFGGGGGDGGS